MDRAGAYSKTGFLTPPQLSSGVAASLAFSRHLTELLFRTRNCEATADRKEVAYFEMYMVMYASRYATPFGFTVIVQAVCWTWVTPNLLKDTGAIMKPDPDRPVARRGSAHDYDGARCVLPITLPSSGSIEHVANG